MVTQKFDLNMIPGKPKPIIRASQYDTGLRAFEVSLFAGTDTYTIPSGATLTVQGTKPDYTGFSYSATYSGNTVTFDCTDQMTACAGAVEMEIAVVNEGERVATANFVLQVEPAALKDDTIISETDIPIIEQLPEMMEDVNTLISTFGGPNVAETAAEMTDQDKVYVYIGSETGYNSGHWYYYDKTAHVWKDGGIYQSAGVEVDNTLSIGGMAADAKATGDALALKADIASPTFTGDPKAPTASLISYNTQIANTEFVQRLVMPLDDAVNGLEPTEIEMHLVVDGTTGTWEQGGKTYLYDLLPGDEVKVTAGERDAYLVWYTIRGGSTAVDVSTSHTVTAGSTRQWGTTDARKLAVLMEDASGNDVSPAYFAINGVEKGLNERVDALETTKQDTLTFDATPTEGSTNPVTSGGAWEAVQTDKTLAVEDKAADAKKTGVEINYLKNAIGYLGNWAYLTKGSGDNAIPFRMEKNHVYTVVNYSQSGGISFNLRETPTGSNLQTVYGLDAGVTKDFIANQDANYIAGWQASEQYFFIIDKSSKIEMMSKDINNIMDLKQSVTITNGGFDEANGTITENQYYSYTDFIDCSVFGMLRVTAPDGNLNYCSWYKDDKTTGQRFTVPQGDVTLTVPSGYKYVRLSAPTANMSNISVYTTLYFNGAIARTYIESIKDLLPNRFTATRSTAGTTDLVEYGVVKGHSYLLINPNDFACSFTPKKTDGTTPTIGSTTVAAKSVNMSVSEFDGFANVYFAGDNGTLYIYDMDGESVRKTVTDLNGDACDAVVSSRYKNSATPHLLTLVHFSDIHADPISLRRIIGFDSDMAEYIDDVICTGDIVSSKYGDSLDFWTTSEGAEKILISVGNHDSYYTNSMDAAQLVPMATVAGKFIDPFVSDWGIISRPSNATYYYKDYASGYRLIVLDSIRTGSDATAEASWLENVLADAKTNNLAVIIAMHYMPTGSMHVYDCQFSKYNMFGDQQNICNAPEFDVHEIVQEFIDGGGQFMCYLIGHLHRDIFGYAYEYSEQPCIMVTTSNAIKASQEINADLGRAIGTKMQDAFNVMTFDKDSGIIKVVRVGADVDNMMRPRKAISYDISSKTFPQN